jgi:hydroxybutyrate-dimer hydrolase
MPEIRVTDHRHGDDLLSAGLGLAGLAGLVPSCANPFDPSSQELRRRAIQSSWKGIADFGVLGGFGEVYGAVPDVPGREFTAFDTLAGARFPHRVLLQAPDAFDEKARCLVVAPSSGSRGVYGAIALAGGWALPRGFAVAYTDKGTGAGYFDPLDMSGVALDGRRARVGEAPLEFAVEALGPFDGLGVKHAHSQDNPEADWGRHVLAAARFGLAMLDRAYPQLAPFTPANTRIIATGLSNGGGAVLRAAGDDTEGLLSGVVALEPNIHMSGRGRPLYDYATEAALMLPCALTSPHFASAPFAQSMGASPLPWIARGASLRALGLVDGATPAAQAADALARLRASGWRDESLATAAASTSLDLWRALGATYASSYLRCAPDRMPCGFVYRNTMPALKPTWWADASGVPPGPGVAMTGGTMLGVDVNLPGEQGLRALWDGTSPDAAKLRRSVDATRANLPAEGLPVIVVHGGADGLVPAAFSADPYVGWLRASGRSPVYWRVPHAQHFDAFLAFPDFGDRYVPLLPYGYAALDRLWAHLATGRPLPEDAVPQGARPRGPGKLSASHLALPSG